MATALEPFNQYITYLAKGKLDGYFDSIRLEDLVTDLEVELPSQPMLLLHDLGKDEESIKRLFCGDIVFVSFCIIFIVNDSSKLRFVQPSICRLWFWKDSPLT